MGRKIPDIAPHEPWASENVDTWRRNVRGDLRQWSSKAPHNDWVPEGDDQWIGDEDQHPGGMVVGKPTGDPDNPGSDGVFANSPLGGVVVAGIRSELPVRKAAYTWIIGTNLGALRGYRSPDHPVNTFGNLVPPTFEGLDVWQLTVNTSSNIVQLVLDDGSLTGAAYPEIPSVALQAGTESVVLLWNAANTRYDVTDADFTAYIVSQTSNNLSLTISPLIGTLANAPVEVSGSYVALMGQVLVEVSAPITGFDRYLLLGESTQLPDGRHVAPLLLGPEYIPTVNETVTDTRDIELDDELGTVENVITLGPLDNAYPPNISTFSYKVRLSEEGGRTSLFTVEIWHQPSGGSYSLVVSREESLNGGALNIDDSFVVQIGAGVGDNIQLRVSALRTHPQTDSWVRGSQFTSTLEMRQG